MVQLMNCIICNAALTVEEEARKVKYCSGQCRAIYYRNRKLKKEILLALRDSTFYNRIKHLKIGTLQEQGFIVIIKEKEISTL